MCLAFFCEALVGERKQANATCLDYRAIKYTERGLYMYRRRGGPTALTRVATSRATMPSAGKDLCSLLPEFASMTLCFREFLLSCVALFVLNVLSVSFKLTI